VNIAVALLKVPSWQALLPECTALCVEIIVDKHSKNVTNKMLSWYFRFRKDSNPNYRTFVIFCWRKDSNPNYRTFVCTRSFYCVLSVYVLQIFQEKWWVIVHYEVIKQEVKRRPIHECRYVEKLKTKPEGSTRLTYIGFRGGPGHLQHLRSKTRLIDERFTSVMGEKKTHVLHQ
jgi:hypothetical protein